MGKVCFGLWLAYHLSVVVLHHVGSATTVFEGMAYIGDACQVLRDITPVRYYAHYTGTSIGSGYFAPRVGSSFHVQATMADTLEGRRRVTDYPLITRAAQLRYTAFCQLFQGFTEKSTDNHAYERALCRHIGAQLAAHLKAPSAAPVEISVSIYRPPTLVQHQQNKPAIFEELYRDTLIINDRPKKP